MNMDPFNRGVTLQLVLPLIFASNLLQLVISIGENNQAITI